MEFLRLGQLRPEWRGFPDGYLMSYDEYNGMTLFFFLAGPGEDVLSQVYQGSEVEVSLADIEKVGFFTLRFGALPRGDCAFSPALYAHAHPPALPPGGAGVPLNVVVVDSAPGAIRYLRTIPLGRAFSEKFCNWFYNRVNVPLTPAIFKEVVDRTYARYATEDLRRMANIAWSSG